MNFIDLMGDFGGLVIVAIFVMLLVITIACILASSIFEEIHDWILNDDAKHLVQNRLPKLKGWKPQGDNLKKFIEKELGGKGFVRGTKQRLRWTNSARVFMPDYCFLSGRLFAGGCSSHAKR